MKEFEMIRHSVALLSFQQWIESSPISIFEKKKIIEICKKIQNISCFAYVNTSTFNVTSNWGHCTQGAGRPFDLPKKFPKHETCVFGFGTTWGTMFTKVILLRMAEAVYCF